MRIKLAYGKTGLWVELPNDHVTVVEPTYVPGVPNEEEALTAALRAPIGAPPLCELARPGDRVAIVFSDITRPQPRRAMLTALLEELSHVPRENIVLINGLGTHRPNTEDELADMLGPDIARGYRIVQHDADDPGLRLVGRTSFGRDIYVNAAYVEAEVRILTGFIEPHFFAGFSGGPKAVLPGIAGHRSIFMNHNAEMIGHPQARWGVTEGNPIWEEMREAALLAGPSFLFNVAINRDKQITGVFAGDMLRAHAEGTRFVAASALKPVPGRFDIVVTTNSGYPLDLNLYQTVKGMSAASQVVKPGGSIVVAAECRDGVPAGSEYEAMLKGAPSPEAVLAMVRAPGFLRGDQWQVQVQAQVQCVADVYVKSDYLDAASLAAMGLKECQSVEETVAALREKYGPGATVCVLPEGPMTIPFVADDGHNAT